LYGGKNDSAEEANFKKSVLIFESLQKKDSVAYSTYLADSYWSLGLMYATRKIFRKTRGTRNEIKKWDSLAVDLTDRAVTIYESLATNNPDAFEAKVAEKYLALGSFGDTTSLKKGLAIFERFSIKDIKAFEPKIAEAYRTLGVEHLLNNDLSAATEAELIKALETYKRLSQENPEGYQSEVAKTLSNLVSFYMNRRFILTKTVKDTNIIKELDTRIMENSKQQLDVLTNLAKKYPQAYEVSLASAYLNIGNAYLNLKGNENIEAAKEAFLKALYYLKKHPEDMMSATTISIIMQYFKNMDLSIPDDK
jgi:tetratricopeptide (TPR) repeat protein